LKATVQVYELPNQHNALCGAIFLVNALIAGAARYYFYEQKHLINPFYAKVGMVGGASEIIASGLIYKALSNTRHENIVTSMSYFSGALVFAYLYHQTRVIPPKSDIYTSSLVFFGAIIL